MKIRHKLLLSISTCFFLTAAIAAPVPTKEIRIYNNTQQTLYPIVETSVHDVKDHWLIGYFKEMNPAHAYIQKHVSRSYINPAQGLAPGQSVTLTVPLYTLLAPIPNPALPNQYVDWWNGMRIYIYDDHDALMLAYKADKPVTTFGTRLTCLTSNCEPLTVRVNNSGLASNHPYQLTEYTFAHTDGVNGALPYAFDPHWVDYDISYVDHAYLPVAMEPINNPDVGYTGTTMALDQFRKRLSDFVANHQWPIYVDDNTRSLPWTRLPGTYNVIIGNQALSTNSIFQQIKSYWDDCTINNSHPFYHQCMNVKELFDRNSANYQKLCHAAAPSDDAYLQHVYGWVAFNCAGVENALPDTPLANYNQAANAYQQLQYNSKFNPYVNLIHDDNYLAMNAYAFSIDDAVGNMNVQGDGIILTIGGKKGLENKNPFDIHKIVTVGLGAPAAGHAAWDAYGICSADANKKLAAGMLSFQILTVNYPCKITLKDTRGELYHFTLQKAPPFAGKNKGAYVQCATQDDWCKNVNVDFVTGHDINTPPTRQGHGHRHDFPPITLEID